MEVVIGMVEVVLEVIKEVVVVGGGEQSHH